MTENIQTEKWISWLRNIHYSSWESTIIPYDGNGKILRTPEISTMPAGTTMQEWKDRWVKAPYLEGLSHARPDRLIKDKRGRWRISSKPDTGDIGNRNIFGVIGGLFPLEEQYDLTRIIKLCGPSKRDIPLSCPHYDLPGGTEFKKIESTRVILYGCSYKTGKKKRSLLFRDMPVQYLRRVEGTAIIVSSVENEEIRISVIDFAPMEPELSLFCRVFIAENLKDTPLKDLTIHQIPVNSGRTWKISASGLFKHFIDKSDATGFSLYPACIQKNMKPSLLQGKHEAGWQQIDLPLHLPVVAQYGTAFSFSIIIPRIKGGDPEESRAMKAALIFDPWKNLISTQKRWKYWSDRLTLKSGDSHLDGLVDSLQVLLKTHEGKNGIHTGSSFQRHTHCWCRDNYMIQRGLLSAGRFEEAEVNLRGFVTSWQYSGVCNGYNLNTHASWGPNPTTEVCSYLILMVRDLHLWTGREPVYHGVWEMIKQCADTIRANSKGLIGFDGDEIWIWELEEKLFREWKEFDQYAVLDNCWLAIAALDYAERIAGIHGLISRANDWGRKKQKISAAVEEKLWDPSCRRYSSFLFPDGKRFSGLLVNGLCTPYYIGVKEVRPGSYATGIKECGDKLKTAEGVIKGNSLTDIYAGLSTAFYLHALGSISSYKAGDEYLKALMSALPASGAPWEYSSVDCPVTGYDKRRAADSGVFLTALIHYITGLEPTWDGFILRPHLPYFCSDNLKFEGLRFHQHSLSLVLDRSGTQVTLDERKSQYVPNGSAFKWDINEKKGRR